MNTPEIMFPNLNISIDKLDRSFITINIADFSLPIYWYGVLITLAVFIGYMLAVREAKRTNQNPEMYLDYLFVALPLSILGARLYYIIFSWDYYKNNLDKLFSFREGGLAIYGGVIVAIATAYIFCRKKKLNLMLFIDTAIPSLILGQAIGRWGNFFNREVFGEYTNSLFALRYLKAQVDSIPQSVMENIVTYNGAEYIQVQPTFLYESVWNLAVFAIMLILRKNKKFDGQILCIYLIGYSIGRFFIEGMRTDQLPLFNTGLHVSQVLSFILFLLGIAIILIQKYRPDFLEKLSSVKNS